MSSTTRTKIADFLRDNQIAMPVDDFVHTVSNIYHKYEAANYDARHFSIQLSLSYWKKTTEELARIFGSRKSISVLDFGCGTGFATDQVLKSALDAKIHESWCYDLSADMVEQCRKKFQAFKNVHYLSGIAEFEKLKDSGKKFDLVMCNALLHHIIEPGELIAIIDKMVDPGGVIVLGHEPNKGFYSNSTLNAISNLFRIYKRIRRRLLGSSAVESGGSDIATLTYNELLEKNLIRKEFDINYIPKLVDVHVPLTSFSKQPWGENGFDLDFVNRFTGGKYELLKTFSYNQIKDQEAYRIPLWKAVGRILAATHPASGADIMFIIRKKN